MFCSFLLKCAEGVQSLENVIRIACMHIYVRLTPPCFAKSKCKFVNVITNEFSKKTKVNRITMPCENMPEV